MCVHLGCAVLFPAVHGDGCRPDEQYIPCSNCWLRISVLLCRSHAGTSDWGLRARTNSRSVACTKAGLCTCHGAVVCQFSGIPQVSACTLCDCTGACYTALFAFTCIQLTPMLRLQHSRVDCVAQHRIVDLLFGLTYTCFLARLQCASTSP